MVEVLSTMPFLVKRSSSRRGQPLLSSQRPRPAGSVSAISCTRGWKNSAISRICPSASLHLLAHAVEPARPDFQFGDAHGVLVGHAERELARGLGEQQARAVAVLALGLGDRLEPVEVFARIGDVLVVGGALDAGADEGARRLGIGARPRPSAARARGRHARTTGSAALRRHAVGRRREAGAERGEAFLDADAAAPDRRLERHALHRQRLAPASAPNSTDADHAAGRFRELRHVAVRSAASPRCGSLPAARRNRPGRRPARSSRSSHRRGWSRR